MGFTSKKSPAKRLVTVSTWLKELGIAYEISTDKITTSLGEITVTPDCDCLEIKVGDCHNGFDFPSSKEELSGILTRLPS